MGERLQHTNATRIFAEEGSLPSHDGAPSSRTLLVWPRSANNDVSFESGALLPSGVCREGTTVLRSTNAPDRRCCGGPHALRLLHEQAQYLLRFVRSCTASLCTIARHMNPTGSSRVPSAGVGTPLALTCIAQVSMDRQQGVAAGSEHHRASSSFTISQSGI